MIRVVSTPETVLALDLTGKKAGRGTYVCPKKECLNQLSRKKLSAALRKDLPDKDVALLKKSLEEMVDFP